MSLTPHTFGKNEASVILVDILNARDKFIKRKVCRLIDSFERRLVAIHDIKNKRIQQSISQLIYYTYKKTVINNYHTDKELINFTLNVLCTIYRDHLKNSK